MGFTSAFWGMVIAFVVLAPFVTTLYQALMLPRIYDVSTDITDPPELFAARQRTERMNPVVNDADSRALQSSAYPQVTGRRYDGSPDRILTAVNKVIADNGWTVVAQKGEPGDDEEILLEVVARTFLLGFTSDAVIRLSDEGETTYVDMRSVSRYGIHDLGENADRITAFMTALDAEVQSAQPEEETTEPASRLLHRCAYLPRNGGDEAASTVGAVTGYFTPNKRHRSPGCPRSARGRARPYPRDAPVPTAPLRRASADQSRDRSP